MKKLFIPILYLGSICTPVLAQQIVVVDLAEKKQNAVEIAFRIDSFQFVNKAIPKNYTYIWARKRNLIPPFDLKSMSGLTSSANNCSDAVSDWAGRIDTEANEAQVRILVQEGKRLLKTSLPDSCRNEVKSAINKTQEVIIFPYRGTLSENETITLTVISLDATPIDTITYTFRTPERTPWLVHYGLTYAPSVLSRVKNYYSLANDSIANQFTVTEQNNEGPKPWENISATINFTYPFSSKNENFSFGYTAGFGLSSGLEISGQTGLSAIIGTNVILSSGVVFLQKHKLMGNFVDNQIIKENLSFNGLHSKVWLPELYFTLGFRFGANPFANKETPKPAATTADK